MYLEFINFLVFHSGNCIFHDKFIDKSEVIYKVDISSTRSKISCLIVVFEKTSGKFRNHSYTPPCLTIKS